MPDKNIRKYVFKFVMYILSFANNLYLVTIHEVIFSQNMVVAGMSERLYFEHEQ